MWKRALATSVFVGMALIGSQAARAYPVKHLPMLEKHLCYVYMGRATESVIVDFLNLIEQDARQTEKRKSLAFISRSVNEQAVLDAKRKVPGGLQRTAAEWGPLDAGAVTDMRDKEGARFIFINTSFPETLPADLVNHLKTISKQRMNLADLPAGAAGYHVYWEWGKRKTMWVVIYAPGPLTLSEITKRCLEQEAYGDGRRMEPSDKIPVNVWHYAVDTEAISQPSFRVTYQDLVENLISAARARQKQASGEWVELIESPMSELPQEQSSSVVFLLHKNVPKYLQEAGDLLQPFQEDLRGLRPNEAAVIASKQSPTRLCYVAASLGLLIRLVKIKPPFDDITSFKQDVPDLTRLKRVALVLTKSAKDNLPEGARAQLLQEVKAGLTFWQVYDETVLQPLLRLEEIGLSGLPGGASAPQRTVPVDAMLIIDVSRFALTPPFWREEGKVKYPQDPPDLPICPLEPSPRKRDAGQWLADHSAWWYKKEEFKRFLAQNEYQAEQEISWSDTASAEISCALIDLRPDSERYGTVIHPSLVSPSLARESTFTYDPRSHGLAPKRTGRFKYALLEAGGIAGLVEVITDVTGADDRSAGEREAALEQALRILKNLEKSISVLDEVFRDVRREPTTVHGRQFMGLAIGLAPGPVRWDMPRYAVNWHSPAVTRVSAMLGNDLLRWLEESALLDPTLKASPPPPPDYIGKVSQVAHRVLTVQVDGTVSVATGDWFEVRCKDGSLPKAQIESVTGNMVTAKLQQPSGSIQAGDEVYQTAPPPPPPPPAEPPSPPPVRVIKVHNEVVISLPLQKRPPSSRLEALKQQAITLAASKQVQLLRDKPGVEVSPRDLLKIAKVTKHSWDARAKQYVVVVRFSGSVQVKGE
jgi:hypothetical protein